MLYLPVACPGSGKSYVGERMIESGLIEPDSLVSPDRYREILCGDRASQYVNGAVFKIVDSIVDHRISHGLDVYLDATNLNSKLRNKLLKRLHALALDFTLPLTILISDEPRWVVEERNINRKHPVPQHVFDRFWDLAYNFDVDKYVDTYNANVLTLNEMLERCEQNES